MRNRNRLDEGRPQRATRLKRPTLEGLEGRLLLYSTTGGLWTYGSRITYSFVPDGTSVGGTPSALFSTLNARFSTATWQAQFQRAAAVWQAVANINLVQVPDNGASIGSTGDQQGDTDFGDIRIGGTPQSSSVLGYAFLPPPFNGGTAAGDVMINTNQAWQINSDFDLQTVAIHEIGHALGMGHASISSAVMFATYNSIKQSLHSDDISGIQSVYSARQHDAYDASASNNTSGSASVITSLIDGNAQISIANLDITSTSDTDWYRVVVPASTTGTMVVKVQSSNLSSLSPRVQVYNAGLSSLGFQSKPNTYGETVSVTISGVSAGQTYFIRASNANTGPTGTGAYGLQVNFANQSQAPVSPPNTVVASTQDQGGGSMNNGSDGEDNDSQGSSSNSGSGSTTIWSLEESNSGPSASSGKDATPIVLETNNKGHKLKVGTLIAYGDFFETEDGDHHDDHGHSDGDESASVPTSTPGRSGSRPQRGLSAIEILGSSADLMVSDWKAPDLVAFGRSAKRR